jgi:hypothetical protein
VSATSGGVEGCCVETEKEAGKDNRF